jgi:hypothetical protein
MEMINNVSNFADSIFERLPQQIYAMAFLVHVVWTRITCCPSFLEQFGPPAEPTR